eukprot:gene20176-25842_t
MATLLPLFFSACQKSVVVQPPVYQTEAAPVVTREPSYISLPISVTYETLKKAIDKTVGNVLYNDDSFENNSNDNIKV